MWIMNQTLRECLAINVKIYREKKGLSREELSLMLGVDNSYVSKIEKGRINITLDKLEQLASLLDINASQLIS